MAVKAIQLAVEGERFTDIMAKTGLTMPILNNWYRWHPHWKALWESARDTGEAVRAARRVDLADRHATEGTNKTVFWQGRECGVIREWDHRLLQWLIEADNPNKYRGGHDGTQVNVQVNSLMQSLAGSGPTSIIRPESSGGANRAGAPQSGNTSKHQ